MPWSHDRFGDWDVPSGLHEIATAGARRIVVARGPQRKPDWLVCRSQFRPHEYRPLPTPIYLSWFDPNGQAADLPNLRTLNPGTPVLWIAGNRDRAQDRSLFVAVSANPKIRFVTISSNQTRTSANAHTMVAGWLSGLR